MSLRSLAALDPVIDHQALLTRCLNKIDFAERMLALFQGRYGEELAELDQAFGRGDLDAVRRIAHRMAGASANAAAYGLQACATEIRHAADAGSLETALKELEELHVEWNKFTAAMSAGRALEAQESGEAV